MQRSSFESFKPLPFIVLTVALLFGYLKSDSQVCRCANAGAEFAQNVNCKPIRFHNGASLYWQYNCDSSWLTYSSRFKKKQMIFSIYLVDYTGRLGYNFFHENKRSFTILNRQISGCCAAPQFILFDKETGRKIHDFGNSILASQSVDGHKGYNFILYFTNDHYDQLTLYFIDSGKKIFANLPKGRLKATNYPNPETLFYDAWINGQVFTVHYSYRKPTETDPKSKDSVQINLGKPGN